MVNIKKLSIIIFILTLFIIPVFGDNILFVRNNDLSIKMTIDRGYYADYEGNGLEDDVIVEYSFQLKFDKNYENYSLEFDLSLVLPSGYNFTYSYVLVLDGFFSLGSTYNLNLRVIFWNHAIESGWYTIYTGVGISDGGSDFDQASLTFDPPEGTDGSRPPSLQQI